MNRKQKIDAILNQVQGGKRGSIPVLLWIKDPKKVMSKIKLKTRVPD